MKTSFKIRQLKEKKLVFGGRNEEEDPRIGLKYFGPYRFSSESQHIDRIKIGVIGDKGTMEKAKEIVDLLSSTQDSVKHNKWLFPPYPGLTQDTNFNISIDSSEVWQEKITQSEIKSILKITDTNERIGKAVEFYLNKIENILMNDSRPNVILCTLPDEIETYCGISKHTRGAKKPKQTELQERIQNFKKKNQTFLQDWGMNADVNNKSDEDVKGFDLRNSLKGKLMERDRAVPIQILKESSMDAILNYEVGKNNPKQDPASFAWNFMTGLYYKADGKPWRLAKLRKDTCYVGISFFKDKLNPGTEFETSMAQVFTDTGEGLVLRGQEVRIDEKTRETHLKKDQAKQFLEECIGKYKRKVGRNPIRVVIHKKTQFDENEKEGFIEALDGAEYDFVTIKHPDGIRFLRQGTYPVLRGTLISLTRSKHILYTSGFIPRLRTYPGHRVPRPLLINHDGDSETQHICDEILGLTKLNWNTADFSTAIPITLAFSKEVGRVLSELEKGKPVKDHYRWYM